MKPSTKIDITKPPRFQKRERVRVIDQESKFFGQIGHTTVYHHYPWVVFADHSIEHFQESQLEKM